MMLRKIGSALVAGMMLCSAPLAAQDIKTVDPNVAIDSDLSNRTAPADGQTTPPPSATYQGYDTTVPRRDGTTSAQDRPTDGDTSGGNATGDYGTSYDPYTPQGSPPPASSTGTGQPGNTLPPPATPSPNTYNRDDLIGAAEGVFGKGAKGLADIIQNILKDQGEPNAYIAGREASGALVVGLRYGSGTLSHKIEGKSPIYWTGPSVGFDVGGDANKVFVLVYNLYDTHDLYKRFPAGEGRVYFVGGFSASYLRRGDIVLIPVRLGVGWRLGANVGYMKFSDHQKWLPF